MIRTIKQNNREIRYSLQKTARRSIEIRVVSQAEVRVFAPQNAKLKDVDAFVASRGEWIEGALKKMAGYQAQKMEMHPMRDGASILYRGEEMPMRVETGARPSVSITDGTLVVRTPNAEEESVRALVRQFLFEDARALIAEQLEHFIPIVGRSPNAIAIRDQRTRWGSCSSKHNLNFNYKLAMAPPEALNYVVVHELCHLYEFNHSDKFWARVAKAAPDYAIWKRWLKQNGHILGV